MGHLVNWQGLGQDEEDVKLTLPADLNPVNLTTGSEHTEHRSAHGEQ